MDIKAKREEIKTLAIQELGFEHPTTVHIFKLDKIIADDVIAAVMMETALLCEIAPYHEEED